MKNDPGSAIEGFVQVGQFTVFEQCFVDHWIGLEEDFMVYGSLIRTLQQAKKYALTL